MGHDGMSGMMMMSYSGRLLLIGFLAYVVLAGVFIARLGGPWKARCHDTYGWMLEAGHVLTSAGMAYMFAPESWQVIPTTVVALVFAVLAVGLLALNASAAATAPGLWRGCNILAAEAFAMAYMAAFSSWGSADLTVAFRVLFGAVIAATLTRLALRGRLALPTGTTTVTMLSRLVMASGMLTMLVLAQPM